MLQNIIWYVSLYLEGELDQEVQSTKSYYNYKIYCLY